jgi:pimeloyl-ACP methyl ester carboxylesterase
MKRNYMGIFAVFIMILLFLGTIQTGSKGIIEEQNVKCQLNLFSSSTDEPTPPDQPTDGPGGSNYSHYGVRKTRYRFGARQYWIFEPYGPKPESAPLIVFNHGWSAIHPICYREWIHHLVKRGNIVVYPRYQRGLYLGFSQFNANAIDAVKDAIRTLQSGSHVLPELDKFAITGHSLGGGITANMAAQAFDEGLPVPKAIMPVQPYVWDEEGVDFANIPAETLMLVVVGEDDTAVGNLSGKIIFENATQIPFSQKDFVVQVTDTYGEPDLVADHVAPACFPFFGSTDAMDYYSTWKLFDALTDYAFYGINEEYCLGNTPEQRFMGLWSDGTPVNELIVTDTP